MSASPNQDAGLHYDENLPKVEYVWARGFFDSSRVDTFQPTRITAASGESGSAEEAEEPQ